jgi:hypothetical protein
MASSTTCVIEMDKVGVQDDSNSPSKSLTSPRPSLTASGRRVGEGADGALPSPVTAAEEVGRWNRPRKNIVRIFACFWGFIIMGANDGAVGALIPYVRDPNHSFAKKKLMLNS